MISIATSTNGLEKLAARVTRRANLLGGQGMRTILQAAGKDLEKAYRARILSSPNEYIHALSPKYAAEKRRAVGFENPVLVRSGQMLRSMYSRVVNDGSWAIRLGFAGERNSMLAAIHIRSGRDFTEIPDGWEDAWQAKLRSAMSRL